MLGIALTNDWMLYEKLKFMQNALGAVPSAFDCYLVMRGLKTLCVRMKKQSESAQFIVDALRSFKCNSIKEILYPDDHKENIRERVRREHHLNMHGSIFSIIFDFPSKEIFLCFISGLQIFTLAESLGGVESLVQVPLLMTHSQLTAEQKEITKISAFLVRFSVGLEYDIDLLEDIKNALDMVA